MVFVLGSVIKPAANAAELSAHFDKGTSARRTRTTAMNASSSRSHLVFSILIETVNRTTGQVATGKLSFVDLAGSERRVGPRTPTHPVLRGR